MRLIDADAMKERFCDGVGEKPFDWVYDIHDLAGALSEMPTIDAVPVVHGRWIKKDILHCSECDMPTIRPWPYCQNCGAVMDGGTQDA